MQGGRECKRVDEGMPVCIPHVYVHTLLGRHTVHCMCMCLDFELCQGSGLTSLENNSACWQAVGSRHGLQGEPITHTLQMG